MKKTILYLLISLSLSCIHAAQWNPQTNNWSNNPNPKIGDWGFNRPGFPNGLYIHGITVKAGEAVINPVIYDNDVVFDVVDDDWAFAMADLGKMNLQGFIVTPLLCLCDWGFYHPEWKQEFYDARNRAIKSGMCSSRIPEVAVGSEKEKCVSSAGADLYLKVINEHYAKDPSKPVIVNIGGQCATLAAAWCKDNSIADKCIVYYTDLTDYNGKYTWASEVVARNFRVVNFGRKYTWWRDTDCQNQWNVLPRPANCGKPNVNDYNSGEWAQINKGNDFTNHILKNFQTLSFYDARDNGGGHAFGNCSDGYFDGTFIHAFAPGLFTGAKLDPAFGGTVLYITSFAEGPAKQATLPVLASNEAYDGKCPNINTSIFKTNIAGEILHIYPNPADEKVNFSINLKDAQHVCLSMIDITGREVKIIADENLSAGKHEFFFTAETSGMYFVKFISDNMQITEKVVFNR